MKTVVVGGGITGLTVAYDLSKKGHDVTVIEKEKTLGGLASGIRMNDVWIEKYYHHMFAGDTSIISLIRELNLADKLIWEKTKMGFYCGGKIYGFGTPVDLLKFSPLGLLDKMKFASVVLSMKKLDDWESLDEVSAEEWLLDKCGKNCYEKIWKPLLKVKFGDEFREISAAWIWGRINPRAKSRTKFMSSEVLGYIEGGFQILMDAIGNRTKENGGRIIVQRKVEKIIVKNSSIYGVSYRGNRIKADNVIFTAPVSQLLKCCNLPKNYHNSLKDIGYQAVVCLMLKLKKPLGEYYWLNISDPSLSMGGVIEHTNFIPNTFYGGNIVYVFKYVGTNDVFWSKKDTEIKNIFVQELKKIFPRFNESDIISSVIFKDQYATPIYDMGFAKKMPKHKTPIEGLYVCGTANVYPLDRNMGNAVKTSKDLVNKILEHGGE